MNKKIRKLCWLIIFCSVFISGNLFAHPHIFIDNTLTIVFDENGLAGIKTRWVFDEMFSSMIREDYDTDKDGRFSPAEISRIEAEAFSNLKNFHYLAYIKINGEKFIVQYVKDFSVRLSDNRVIYTFFIPCHVLAGPSDKEVRISMYDNTYYIDVALVEKDPVRVENTSLVDCRYKVVDNRENYHYYCGQVFPYEIILKFKK